MLLAESLERLGKSDWIDAIVIVAPVGWEEPAILLAEELSAGKVNACVPGGATRAESVRAGVAEVPDDAAVILVHDAARPFLPDDVIERVLTVLGEGGTAPFPAYGSPTRSNAPAPTAESWRRSSVTGSWPYKPTRHSSRRRSSAPSRASLRRRLIALPSSKRPADVSVWSTAIRASSR